MVLMFARLRRCWCVLAVVLVVSVTAAAEVKFNVGQCESGDNYGPLGTVALLRKKATLSAGEFSAYWRDVHGLLAARIPGFWRYTQYHLAAPWAEFSAPAGDRLPVQGIAEVSYCHPDDIAGLAASPVAELIMHDEQNVFAGSYLYAVASGDGGSLLEPSQPLAPVAAALEATFLLVIAKAPSESQAAFRQALVAKGRAMLTACPGIETLRVNAVQPYQQEAWPAPGVDHVATPGLNALVELQFSSRQAALGCLRSEAFFTEPGQRMLTVYPVAQRYTLVADGRPTLLGLRGLSAYQLIHQLGASNQQQRAVLDILYGK